MREEKIKQLAQIFAKYKICPQDCYDEFSSVRVFQKMFPDNYFSKDLETLISYQLYEPIQRGADLPWWGQKYFTEEPGQRVMIISQDSLAEDAGSVVFWAFLYPVLHTKEEYCKFIDRRGMNTSFAYNSWKKIFDQINDWMIDLDFCYITDASKVYKKSSWKNRDFDHQKSKELLEEEIVFCNPDVVILLGAQSLSLVDSNKNYAETVEAGKSFLFNGRKCIVSPFLSGNGPSQKNFKERFFGFVYRVEQLLEKYEDPKFNRYKYIDSMPPSVYKSLQYLITEKLLRTERYENLYKDFLRKKFGAPRQTSIQASPFGEAEKIVARQKILKKREQVEQELINLLKKTKSDFTLNHIKDVIYNEEETGDLVKIIAMFDRGQGLLKMDNILQVINEAWNLFPHRCLDGLSPEEKLLEYRMEH
ncbi:hypothetical protein KJ751_02055 [Patescibacteria group bacterium]|nr:hypothetical protein [Patescibacteria group bacterium]